MPPDRTYHIRPVLDGETLAAAVRILLKDVSWAQARQLVRARKVQVNGNLCLDDARRVKAGDVVKVFDHARAPVPTERDVRVRHVDGDVIVIEKPPGITTLRHAEERGWDADRRNRQPTLEEIVQRLAPAPVPSKSGGKPGRPVRRSRPAPAVRAVHRLDRDTSGLMVFALSPRAEQVLIERFKAHAITRRYVAVVHGRVGAPRTIESYIVRDRGDGLRGSSPRGADDPDAQRAVTHVRPVEHLGGGGAYTVVECELETGRTHQIRIHLSEAGHMLCGERVYTRPRPGAEPARDDSGAPRQALHSARLELDHPVTGQRLAFTSDLPKDLRTWLDGLLRVNGTGGPPA